MVRDALDNATRLLEDIELTIPKLNCQVKKQKIKFLHIYFYISSSYLFNY